MNEANIPHITLGTVTVPKRVAVISGVFGTFCGLCMYGFVKVFAEKSVNHTIDLVNLNLEANAILDSN